MKSSATGLAVIPGTEKPWRALSLIEAVNVKVKAIPFSESRDRFGGDSWDGKTVARSEFN
jgi:hypothetical protein